MLDVKSVRFVGVTFAYLFARFPSLTQTFCFREVEEMSRQMGAMPIWSLRYPKDFSEDCPVELASRTHYLPDRDELKQMFRSTRTMLGHFPLSIIWQVKRWGDKKGKYRLYEAAWLGRELKGTGVTHIHTHFAGIGARTAWWINKLYGISYSFTGHANDMFCSTDEPLLLQDLVENASFVVTVSDFSRQWLLSQYPDYSAKIYKVYNGMKCDLRPRNSIDASSSKIISVGRLIEKKGFEYLIEACSLLRDFGYIFKCQIIGNGPLEDHLRHQVINLGLDDFVELTGSLPWEEVNTRLVDCTVFVLACVNEDDGGMDNLPTVILEAMNASLPVVSTGLAAIPEMVEDGRTGILVDECDANALASVLAYILKFPNSGKDMGRAGKELAAQKFSVEKTVESLKSLIERSMNA
tara:strand:+ start:136 stop:1362 length:1227 start_codon:yes stop_codon:yes gene_type:complete